MAPHSDKLEPDAYATTSPLRAQRPVRHEIRGDYGRCSGCNGADAYRIPGVPEVFYKGSNNEGA